MFHNTTTLHRDNHKTSFTGRPNRMVFGVDELKLDWLQAKHAGRGFKKWMGRLSWVFGGPLIWKGAQLAGKGVRAGMDGLNWTFDLAAEEAKSIKDIALNSSYKVGGAYAEEKKRTLLWEVPKASLSALWRTPIAIAKSPINLIRGVRDGVKANVSDLYNNFTDFKPLATLNSTRKLVQDVMVNSVTYTAGPVIKPIANVGKEIGLAKWQWAKGTRDAIDETFKGGRRAFNGPKVATEKLHFKQEIRKRLLIERAKLKKKRVLDELEQLGIKPKKNWKITEEDIIAGKTADTISEEMAA